MPEIEITEDQRAYLDDLRAELAAEHVGEYGAVRERDALQFLIDRHEGDAAGLDGEESAESDDPADAADAVEDDGAEEASEDEPDDDAGDGDSGGPGRLQTMMQLLEEHDDKWEEVDSEQGKYAVTLPDGETEHVRTKDDVRGLLFKQYG